MRQAILPPPSNHIKPIRVVSLLKNKRVDRVEIGPIRSVVITKRVCRFLKQILTAFVKRISA